MSATIRDVKGQSARCERLSLALIAASLLEGHREVAQARVLRIRKHYAVRTYGRTGPEIHKKNVSLREPGLLL